MVGRALLGSTGVAVSRLGIGGWQAGGTGPWGGGPRADDEQAIAAIRYAVDGGVNWVDTAASYGLGHSEEVVARALRPWRVGDEVLVFTKCGHPWEPPDRIWTELTPASIRRQCEESLRRIGTERIDLFQFHHPDPEVPVEESWGTMSELVEEGKVRWAGVSNFDVDLLERCEAIMHVDCLQPELSLLRPEAAGDVIPWCEAHGTGVICYSPLASGLLAATPTEDRRETYVDTHPPAELGRLDVLGAGLRGIAADLGVTQAAVAVAWVLATPGVTGAICGARNPLQVETWIGAADVDLGPALTELEALLQSAAGSD